MTYDGQSRLATLEEKDNGASQGVTRLIWSGQTLCEERDQTVPATPTVLYFPDGEQQLIGGGYVNGWYFQDQLGSVLEVYSVVGTRASQRRFDEWGNMSGDAPGAVGTSKKTFAGLWQYPGLNYDMAAYRWYSPVRRGWPSRDPLGELGPDGPNLYGYVRNDPLNRFDPFGDTSKTHGTFNGVMVHSEVPTAGGGTGNVHLQMGNNKFFFNTQTGAFDGLPKDIAKQMENNKGLRNAVKNAVNRVNCEGGGFAPKYGGGLGKYVPAIAVALALLDGTAQAENLANLTRDYMAASASGDEGKKLMDAAAIADQLNGVTPLAGDIALGELLK